MGPCGICDPRRGLSLWMSPFVCMLRQSRDEDGESREKYANGVIASRPCKDRRQPGKSYNSKINALRTIKKMLY